MNRKYYVIEHWRTGELMPQMRRDKGYTHWNPTTGVIPEAALLVPRLMISVKQAERVITQWFTNPNMSVRYWEGGEETVRVENDGRKKDDLRIRSFNMQLDSVIKELVK